eukprot:CAMPEP_0183754200 /NCGR_PEP_ID=MMETSP0739-20130205/3408_1 /TAXON_ID=385413 /ORGANISM="Thalassiosira miniscula, Strain CCMP1093" /LENGTH=810 /DNA_ID=CAMNT_0025990809 /DNA_START=26 /DNA_END=2458 /DNA_ORIENTATION=-
MKISQMKRGRLLSLFLVGITPAHGRTPFRTIIKEYVDHDREPVDSAASCYGFLYQYDANGDGIIQKDEYTKFIAKMSEGGVNVERYQDLPFVLKVNFADLSCHCKSHHKSEENGGDACCEGPRRGIYISGTGPQEFPTPEEDAYLRRACEDTQYAISATSEEITQATTAIENEGVIVPTTKSESPTSGPADAPKASAVSISVFIRQTPTTTQPPTSLRGVPASLSSDSVNPEDAIDTAPELNIIEVAAGIGFAAALLLSGGLFMHAKRRKRFDDSKSIEGSQASRDTTLTGDFVTKSTDYFETSYQEESNFQYDREVSREKKTELQVNRVLKTSDLAPVGNVTISNIAPVVSDDDSSSAWYSLESSHECMSLDMEASHYGETRIAPEHANIYCADKGARREGKTSHVSRPAKTLKSTATASTMLFTDAAPDFPNEIDVSSCSCDSSSAGASGWSSSAGISDSEFLELEDHSYKDLSEDSFQPYGRVSPFEASSASSSYHTNDDMDWDGGGRIPPLVSTLSLGTKADHKSIAKDSAGNSKAAGRKERSRTFSPGPSIGSASSSSSHDQQIESKKRQSRSRSAHKERDSQSKSRRTRQSRRANRSSSLTDRTTIVDTQGRCSLHPFVQLRRFSTQTGDWKSLLDACPLCESLEDDHTNGSLCKRSPLESDLRVNSSISVDNKAKSFVSFGTNGGNPSLIYRASSKSETRISSGLDKDICTSELDRMVAKGDWEGIVSIAFANRVNNERHVTSPNTEMLQYNETADIREEIESIITRIVPEESENIDEIMLQFVGREESLIEALWSMEGKLYY